MDILTDAPPSDPDVRLAYGREPLQFGDLRLPPGDGPFPLVVTVHGGYWQAHYNLTHLGHACVDLAAHGIATWNVEYRRIGDPGGGYPGTLEDAAAALSFVEQLADGYPLELDRLAAFGHSAGGQLALWAGARTGVALRGVVSAAGVTDLYETARRGDDHGLIARLLGGSAGEVPARWEDASPSARLPLRIRQVIACGTADLHFEPNERYAEAARAAGDDVELLAFPGADHFELIDPVTSEWGALRRVLGDLLA